MGFMDSLASGYRKSKLGRGLQANEDAIKLLEGDARRKKNAKVKVDPKTGLAGSKKK